MDANFDHAMKLAEQLAADFNRTHGHEFLQLAPRPLVLLEMAEIRAQAEAMPGEYIAANLFRAVKGRQPTHAENVKLGQLLGFMGAKRRKSGQFTLWKLDKAFAQRSH